MALDSLSCLADGCSSPGGGDTTCPASDTTGLRVGLITVKALLNGHAVQRLEGKAYRFCPDPDCDVVYFDRPADSVFRKHDLTTRVGQKESDDPIPLCYCFDITLSDLRRDMAAGGKLSIPAMIAAQIRAGHCACEVKNPEGSCCLGNVTKAARGLGFRAVSSDGG